MEQVAPKIYKVVFTLKNAVLKRLQKPLKFLAVTMDQQLQVSHESKKTT